MSKQVAHSFSSEDFSFIKQKLAREAVALVEPGMRVGLGSGSTAREFILALGERVRNERLAITAVASSRISHLLAQALGIPFLDPALSQELDLVVDGADEVDANLRMIKGGGGALFREKILLQSGKRNIILVDERKLVSVLGTFPLPIEISPFGCSSVEKVLNQQGYIGDWRKTSHGERFITDNGNYIYDVSSPDSYPHPEEDLIRLLQIRGIIDVGFVIAKAEVWVGYADGTVVRKEIT
ncbi:ribose-5-phosphate isomerase [Chlamydia muridarum str. Nigg]|uniref:Ribose-5-phosphate isomerase A n=2 Tax=Chlamydia muridarum TaxID=83560 RepID=RPIA_CHLMU|nr:ribose-5-phosphate isomerase RpiA [Chlamydia muridarum]Q9PKI0.1 RecName: Full=Ribose-5-phosphate isomerase A; AltName: Full=Phosphoriboisomerase A; Short=PRI [Chlamydia muridarum str. Nigg]UFW99740.1 ribose-5-phosphate isomerase RpiA [Chlamydia trachomatis]AAF39331.1 ribose 5-phosphate isomerase [Chlamydia muridarum str. Nigg]AHH22872.1 ribose 5-phosphate isomerase [Chlamydia muridarum str. Nigg3 CMUT3-5]AHH23797.1 ribose 5-phosphate isomerase [Chlamydia muridarum str. Nigg CM972]AID38006.